MAVANTVAHYNTGWRITTVKSFKVQAPEVKYILLKKFEFLKLIFSQKMSEFKFYFYCLRGQCCKTFYGRKLRLYIKLSKRSTFQVLYS